MDGHSGILSDKPYFKGFSDYYACIREQDNIAKENLEHGQQIRFISNKDLPIKINKNDSEEESDKESDEDIEYPLVYWDFLNNSMSIQNLGLAYKDEVILKCSKIKLFFKYPNRQQTMMEIVADDNMKGFTVGELALKVMQRYHMLYYINYNYNVKDGKVIDVPHTFEWNRPYVQPPIPDGNKVVYDFLDKEFIAPKKDTNAFDYCYGEPCFEYEWTDNGIKYLKYNKQMDYWEVICINYI